MTEHVHTSSDGIRYRLIAIRKTTPTSDTSPKSVTVRLKTFWQTTRTWTDADISAYQHAIPSLAGQIQAEQYWDRKGNVRTNRFTCEDFALRVLAQFAASRGLPVRLTTGVRNYQNLEIYGESEHERYDATTYGFVDMVALTFGAPDVQRVINTIRLDAPHMLRPGDMLVQANDRGGIGHHVQLITRASASSIAIMQGNSSGIIVRPFTTAMRMLGLNRADPRNSNYAGMRPETGLYTKSGDTWHYRNETTGADIADFLKQFQLYRWNFAAFNR